MPAEPQKELYFLDRGEHAVDDAGRDDQENPGPCGGKALMSETRPIQMPTLMNRRAPADAGGSAVRLALEGPEWVASASEGVGGVDERAG